MEKEFKAPKVGDIVNHVARDSQKITPAKIVAVSDTGRSVTVELPFKKKNADGDLVGATEKVTVPYREQSKLAGNTWHFALLAFLLALAISLVPSAQAALPTYHTLSAFGTPAAPAFVIFPADPNSQIRLVSVYYSADTNAATMTLSSGTTAYSIMMTNPAATWTTNVIDSTNGLAAGATVFLQHIATGTIYTNTIAASGVANTGTSGFTNYVALTNAVTTMGVMGQGQVGSQSTNVSYIITSAGWPVIPAPGDELYLQGAVTTVPVGAATNFLNGDDIFSGAYGRPVMVQLTGFNTTWQATGTNRLYSVSSHYDSASQP